MQLSHGFRGPFYCHPLHPLHACVGLLSKKLIILKHGRHIILRFNYSWLGFQRLGLHVRYYKDAKFCNNLPSSVAVSPATPSPPRIPVVVVWDVPPAIVIPAPPPAIVVPAVAVGVVIGSAVSVVVSIAVRYILVMTANRAQTTQQISEWIKLIGNYHLTLWMLISAL